jgi:hypothetical protein
MELVAVGWENGGFWHFSVAPGGLCSRVRAFMIASVYLG